MSILIDSCVTLILLIFLCIFFLFLAWTLLHILLMFFSWCLLLINFNESAFLSPVSLFLAFCLSFFVRDENRKISLIRYFSLNATSIGNKETVRVKRVSLCAYHETLRSLVCTLRWFQVKKAFFVTAWFLKRLWFNSK